MSEKKIPEIPRQKNTAVTMGDSHQKPKKDRNKGRFHKDMTTFNIVITILAVLADAAVVYTMFNTTQFSGLSGSAFILINIAVMLVTIAMNFLVMIGIRSKKKGLYIGSVVFLAALLSIGSYGTYVTTRATSSIGKMTQSTTTESVSTSFVVYSSDGNQAITDVAALDGRRVGYAAGTNTAELGQKQLQSSSVNASMVEYQDYSSELRALFNGDIDAAILPSNYVDMFQNEASFADYLANTTSIMDFEDTVTVANEAGANKDLTKEPFTVLLIGNADGLSDTMILTSINPISMKVIMISLARDSYVPISCYNGGYSKLNAAHSVSVGCTIQTIEDLVGVDIDYYVDTNFQGVVDVVDALGGIVVNSPLEFVGQSSSTERGHYNVWVPAGDNVVLNGEQALAFARERHAFASGDFARQEHQQEVIMAMLQKIMRTRDINTFLNVLEAAGKNIQTNMSVEQMTGFLSYALQKSNRLYDSEHVEDVFDIEHSRITGYNSSLWDNNLQMALYIYRLWNGALSDAKKAIERNSDLDSAITAETSDKWNFNWDFEPPALIQETYNEEKIVDDSVPTTISNFTGQNINNLTTWADGFNIIVNVNYVTDTSVPEGTITYQDIPEGTQISDVTAINVTVATSGAASTASAEATPASTVCPDGNTYTAGTNCELYPAKQNLTTQAGCDAAHGAGSWYNGKCYSNQTEAATAKQADDNAAAEQAKADACKNSGGNWVNNACSCTGSYETDSSTGYCKLKPSDPGNQPSGNTGGGESGSGQTGGSTSDGTDTGGQSGGTGTEGENVGQSGDGSSGGEAEGGSTGSNEQPETNSETTETKS